ncbi:elongation factor P 5-aminopentanone reductase [Oceanobacillus senegalensis]|uniref:elongation factor P 5-aminopentanone reductase n=1 Tax=Oceanobacillus senegalensis TaxID=1936063 RepID=UPI000A313AAE|nr:SDR family oxidoreductase [Oceanobacillus senegalensis]
MDKNILIIGASGDIGKAIVKRLSEEGYQLILHYHRNSKAIRDLRREINDKGILSVIQADLGNVVEIEEFLKHVTFHVDGVIFASGKAYYGLFQETPEEVLNQMLNIHVKAPWRITQSVLSNMIQQSFGKIIFITSIWGDIGASLEVVYSTVKGAQNTFVKALAKEVAPNGISVNAISPGFIDTKMNSHLSDEERSSIYMEIPMNRAGSPDEVAHTVSFLLDQRSSYIQGEILNITGGW